MHVDVPLWAFAPCSLFLALRARAKPICGVGDQAIVAQQHHSSHRRTGGVAYQCMQGSARSNASSALRRTGLPKWKARHIIRIFTPWRDRDVPRFPK